VYLYPTPPDPENPSHHPAPDTVSVKPASRRSPLDPKRVFIVHNVRDFPTSSPSIVAHAPTGTSAKHKSASEKAPDGEKEKKEPHVVFRRIASHYDVQSLFHDAPHQSFHISTTRSDANVGGDSSVSSSGGGGPPMGQHRHYLAQQALVQEQREFEESRRAAHDVQVALGARFATELLDAPGMGFTQADAYPRNGVLCSRFGRNNTDLIYPFYFRNRNSTSTSTSTSASGDALPLFTIPSCDLAEGIVLQKGASSKRAKFKDLVLECNA
jgi:hypothetical protein